MYGAICADIILNQRDNLIKESIVYPLFPRDSFLGGNSILTLAVAEAVMNYFDYDKGSKDLGGESDRVLFRNRVDNGLRKWALRYPNARNEVALRTSLPDDTERNTARRYGPAARVSPVAWLFEDMDTVRKAAVICASVTDSDPDTVKEAEAIASAIFLARMGKLKKEIAGYLSDVFEYDRASQQYGRIFQAMKALQEGVNYGDVIRKASRAEGFDEDVPLMAGSIAHAYYGIGVYKIFLNKAKRAMSSDQLAVCMRYRDHSGGVKNPGNITGYVSPAAVRLLPEEEREIARYYLEIMDVYKTAERFDADVDYVIRIATDLTRRHSRAHSRHNKFRDYFE